MANDSTPRKAMFFLNNLYGGGAERVALNLAAGFREEGWSTELVLSRREGSYCSQIPPNLAVRTFNTRTPFGTFFKLVHHLRKEKPDILFTFLPRETALALLGKKMAPATTRFCVSEQNTPSEVLKISRWYYGEAYKFTIRHLYPRADGIVAVSEGVSRDLTKIFGIEKNRIRVIYNPLVGPDVGLRSAEAQNHPWFEEKSTPLLLAVGRLHPQKDFFTLLEAFDEVRRQTPCRLLILGEGHLRGELEKRVRAMAAEEEIFMPGFVTNPYAWMARADALVVSSVTEGLCNVIVESIACGTSVVSTDCPHGPAEVLEGGRLGHLVPIASPKRLAEAILLALKSPTDPELLRSRAAKYEKTGRIRDYAGIAEELCQFAKS